MSLGLLLSGDGPVGGAGTPQGIDPLQVLDFYVKPNVIVVLDSSGSMQSTTTDTGTGTGDNPRAKLFQAKTVLQQVIQANQQKVNFQFGTYTQQNSVLSGLTAGASRFRYQVASNDTASHGDQMVSTELTLSGPPGGPFVGAQVWQDIQAGWNTLYFGENVTTISPPSVTISSANDKLLIREQISSASPGTYIACTVTLPSALYGTYTTHAALGGAGCIASSTNCTGGLVGSINAYLASGYAGAQRTCSKVGSAAGTGPTNTYQIRYQPGNGNSRFDFRRSACGTCRRWQVQADISGSFMPALGFTASIPFTPTNGSTPPTSSVPSTGGLFTSTSGTYWATTATYVSQLVGSSVATPQSCALPIPVGFYQTGAQLATAMQNAMNTDAACLAARGGAGANQYSVTFNTGNGQFTFARASGGNNFQMQWAATPNNIRGALSLGAGTATTGFGTSFSTNNAIDLASRTGSNEFTENIDPDGAGPAPTASVTFYQIIASRLWNGQTITVQSDGTMCGQTNGPPTNPPTLNLQQVNTCATPTVIGSPVKFTFVGGDFGGNNVSCNGFASKVDLFTCETPSMQIDAISPFISRELPLNADGTIQGYVERTDGTYAVQTAPTNQSAKADGLTPIANSLIDLKTIFDAYWTGTPVTVQGVPIVVPSGAISTHENPKERTIILFVTDGDDTCENGGSGDNDNALRAAYRAEQLYNRIDAAEVASSVTTYVIGYGNGLTPGRMNWIAWGGSGMSLNPTAGPADLSARWDHIPTPSERTACTTCINAFIAPDPESLASVLEGILNQGTQFGEFTAQSTLTSPVMEYAKEIPAPVPTPTGFEAYDPFNPDSRYSGLFQVAFRSTFELPGFKGQLKAIVNQGGAAVERWNAGQKLADRVTNGLAPCADGVTGQCIFSKMFDGTTSNGEIDRRIYTTNRNGVFVTSVSNLINPSWVASDGNRVPLWPPTTSPAMSSTAPASDTLQGVLDAALGLPVGASFTAANFTALQTKFKVCQGTPLPVSCTGGTDTTRTQRARREAREMLLAYLAGAKITLDASGYPVRKATTPNAGEILYSARDWQLPDSTLADSALVGQPLGSDNGPEVYQDEYKDYVHGPRQGGEWPFGIGHIDSVPAGFGQLDPDNDDSKPSSGPDSRTALKPVMTVIFVPANDMLHAFRAGPNNTASTCVSSSVQDCGGEELWGFLPFDQLSKLQPLMLNPPSRNPHTYVMAAPVRFADMFVPSPGTGSGAPSVNADDKPFSAVVGTVSVEGKGVWRRFLFVGRGIGGTYLTALDVTNVGPFTRHSSQVPGPVVMWNRGYPDTQDGTVGGAANNTAADKVSYAKMGETWSVPAVAYVDRFGTNRKPCVDSATSGLCAPPTSDADKLAEYGVEQVLYVGSGFPQVPGQGTVFYTLDALTGDVVATADVGARATLPAGGYPNAIVASPSLFVPPFFKSGEPAHPFGAKAERVYVGDLHGRLWKFNTSDPATPILFADLGVDQPVATPASLLKFDAYKESPSDKQGSPYVYVTSGNERRATASDDAAGPQFRLYGFKDEAADGDPTPPAEADSCGVTSGALVELPCLFTRKLEPLFRGTVQPATAYSSKANPPASGVAIFGGTRFVAPPPGALAEPVPPYPCRSRFDSIVYVVQAFTGGAAYDLNADPSADDAFVVFDNSKIAAITIVSDPTGDGNPTIQPDEGLAQNPPAPPPPPGKAPVEEGSSAVFTVENRPGSTVCRDH